MIEFQLTIFESFMVALLFVGLVISLGFIAACIVDIVNVHKAGKGSEDKVVVYGIECPACDGRSMEDTAYSNCACCHGAGYKTVRRVVKGSEDV